MTPATMNVFVMRYEAKMIVRISATTSASLFLWDAFSPRALAQAFQIT
jgi:hypothetical protein